MIEGKCVDCGIPFISFGIDSPPPGPPRCMICQWIRDAKPEDRNGIRTVLWREDAEAWKYWRENGAYFDETYPEREWRPLSRAVPRSIRLLLADMRDGRCVACATTFRRIVSRWYLKR